MSAALFPQNMDNPYSAPQGQIYTPTGSQAPLTWKQILFSFEGRIPRRTYWGFSLLMGSVQFVLAFVLTIAFGPEQQLGITIVCWILTIWPAIAVAAKRWHDRDKSAGWICIVFIPLLGPLWFFVECGCLRGTEGPNKYGEDPT